ncbi:hypothetical protein HDF24_21740 [Mucilaginibacter sp. X4EP1]|nr:hypothetical protein [Mucilaginibacter sp. X4EP1]MCS3812393.1 hypothetical protein [Mucilaginibacter sp. X4EP1]
MTKMLPAAQYNTYTSDTLTVKLFNIHYQAHKLQIISIFTPQ